MNDPLHVGARVRIRRSVVPGVSALQDEGEVVRVDGRGIFVRLDPGRVLLVEPRMLTVQPLSEVQC